MNIVLDTNVIVAALRSRRGASHVVVQRIRAGGDLTLHLSAAVVLEYEEILLREIVPELAGAEDVAAFLDELVAVAVCHSRIEPWRPLSVDPDDDCLMELALTADAEALITFNKAHFRPAEAMGIELLTPGEFLQRL